MSYWGDFPLEETLNFLFTTRAFATGIPTVLAGTPVLSVYEDTNLTQITAGVTVTADHDAVVGLNRANVVATAANGYEAGKTYTVVITTGTVGGVSVVGEVVGTFTIDRGAALRPTTAGRSLDVAATGEAGVDFGNILGTLDAAEIGANAITSAKIATDAIGAAQIAANAIGASELATDAIGDAQIATGAIASTAFAVGAINAAAIATDAIGSNELAVDAITNSQIADSARDKINAAEGFHNLTADAGGSTTTLVDAALTQADDYWNNGIIVFTGGPNIGLSRTITDFVAASDTLTFQPALLTAVGAGDTYYIRGAHGPIVRDGHASADVRQWVGAAVNALVAGAVDADVSAFQANVITAAALATDAVNEIRDAILSDSTAFAGANIALIKTEADKIAAADAGAGVAGSVIEEIENRATPAQVNTEVSDVLKTDTVTLPGQAAPPLTPTLEEILSWLYKTFRNRKTQTATQWSLLADDESTVDAKATVSDDATTAIKQEIVSGP